MHSLGSSYLICEGAEGHRYGGASVKVSEKLSDYGELTIRLTDFRSHDQLGADAEFLHGVATRAYERFFRHYLFCRDDWDIEIFDFAYYPKDLGERTVHLGVYNAMVSAFSAWDNTFSVWTRRRG
jgi:hypothetical protein